MRGRNYQPTLKQLNKFTKIGSGESFSSLTGSGCGSGSGTGTDTGAFSRGFGIFLAVTFPAAKGFASCGWMGMEWFSIRGHSWKVDSHRGWARRVTFFRGSLACGCSLTLLPISPRAVLGLSPGLEAAAVATGTRFAPAILSFALLSAFIFVFWKKQDHFKAGPARLE